MQSVIPLNGNGRHVAGLSPATDASEGALALARQLLGAEESLALTLSRGRVTVTVEVLIIPPPGQVEPAPGSAAAGQVANGLRLRTIHRKLLGVATATPTGAKQLARLAGYVRCNSYVRTALTELNRAGLLLHTPDGYYLPGKDGDS